MWKKVISIWAQKHNASLTVNEKIVAVFSLTKKEENIF